MVSAEHQPSLGRTVLSLSVYQWSGSPYGRSGYGTLYPGVVAVTPDTKVVTLVPGDRAELKPNVQIFIAGATRDPGGTLEASRVTVGKDDIPPPM